MKQSTLDIDVQIRLLDARSKKQRQRLKQLLAKAVQCEAGVQWEAGCQPQADTGDEPSSSAILKGYRMTYAPGTTIMIPDYSKGQAIMLTKGFCFNLWKTYKTGDEKETEVIRFTDGLPLSFSCRPLVERLLALQVLKDSHPVYGKGRHRDKSSRVPHPRDDRGCQLRDLNGEKKTASPIVLLGGGTAGQSTMCDKTPPLETFEQPCKVTMSTAFEYWKYKQYWPSRLPRCLATSPLGEKLIARMVEADWKMVTPDDVPPIEPLSTHSLMQEERRLGLRSPKSANCGMCRQPATKYKCTGCWLVYYCDGSCQRLHWRQHKMECVPPTCQVEERDAIAVPDYHCFQLYRKHVSAAEDYEYGWPHIVVLPEDQFIEKFGSKELQRTCLMLAIEGRPSLVFAKFIVRPDV